MKHLRNFHAENSTAPPLGIYVHFPWCLKKCGYCDFLSLAADRPDLPHSRYADAVISEMERRLPELGERRLESVFFGGGTPSLWDTRELARVLRSLRGAFRTSRPEITVECNPTSFDATKAEGLLQAGVTRVSLGVQSLHAERLTFLGRLHDAPGGLSAVETALRCGFERVSADLIFGVAGQSPEEAAREARTVADLGVTHLSAYALTIEPGTQFGALARKGRLPLLGDDLVAESFLAVDEALGAASFDHYEVSNYAREGHVARHNLGYWRGDEYLGLGCGAWGTLRAGGRMLRYRNTPNVDRYMEIANAFRDEARDAKALSELVHTVEDLDPETLLRERLMLGLRLSGGLDVGASARAVGAEAWPPERARAADRLVARGHLIREGPTLRIPKSAWLFADGTIAELL